VPEACPVLFRPSYRAPKSALPSMHAILHTHNEQVKHTHRAGRACVRPHLFD